jgi:hypothetical protein
VEYPFFFKGRVLLNIRYLTCAFAQGPKRPKVDLVSWVQCQERHGAPHIFTWVECHQSQSRFDSQCDKLSPCTYMCDSRVEGMFRGELGSPLQNSLNVDL